MTFDKLGVRPEIVQELKNDGIVNPTEIQEKALPIIKAGKDLVGISRTGSGKTVAFGIPILEKIQPGKGVQALILAPTRELADQIAREMKKFSKTIDCKITVIFGGVSLEPQVQKLKTADIVVGTPGRILDHLGRGTLNLSNTNAFALDEADKMVEMGFVEDIRRILDYTPKSRQILLFGATISSEIDALKRDYMKNPETVKAALQVKKDLLKQFYYEVKHNEKFSLLVHLLKNENTDRSIIFCSARNTVDMVTDNLKSHGVRVEKIHGKLSQNKRLRVIKNFNDKNGGVLVASAVAARGLDISNVSHVFNYDLSQDPQEYIHRIGRTARAGESGKAITLLCQRDYEAFGAIKSRYDVPIEKLEAGKVKRLAFKVQRKPRRSFQQNGRGRGRFNRSNDRGRAPRNDSWFTGV